MRAVLARWEVDGGPTIRQLTSDQVLEDEAVLDGCVAAWVLVDEASADLMFDLLGILSERHIATALSEEGDPAPPGTANDDAAVAAPLEAGADVVLAVLRTACAQSIHIRALKTEIKLMQLRQGGLANQIQQLDEEMRLAALLQREFIPHEMPSVHAIGFHAMFRPAGYVSGDIYDIIRLDDDRVGVFIADAVGHGVPAALMTIAIKRSLVTSVPDAGAPNGRRIVPPNEAMSRLNNELSKSVSSRRGFPSACYCVINCRTLEVSLARAGHPFPMVLKADGSQEWIKPQGTLLGIFADGTYELAKWTLSPGDRLVIYSDGFEQAFPSEKKSDADTGGPSGTFSYGYSSEFLDLARGPVDRAFDRLTARLDEQAGSLNQDDDLTVVCASVAADYLVPDAPADNSGP